MIPQSSHNDRVYDVNEITTVISVVKIEACSMQTKTLDQSTESGNFCKGNFATSVMSPDQFFLTLLDSPENLRAI